MRTETVKTETCRVLFSIIGGSEGAPPARASPRVEIFSFQYTNSSKRSRLGSRLREILDPPLSMLCSCKLFACFYFHRLNIAYFSSLKLLRIKHFWRTYCKGHNLYLILYLFANKQSVRNRSKLKYRVMKWMCVQYKYHCVHAKADQLCYIKVQSATLNSSPSEY